MVTSQARHKISREILKYVHVKAVYLKNWLIFFSDAAENEKSLDFISPSLKKTRLVVLVSIRVSSVLNNN